jgi:hypothetical protein
MRRRIARFAVILLTLPNLLDYEKCLRLFFGTQAFKSIYDGFRLLGHSAASPRFLCFY